MKNFKKGYVALNYLSIFRLGLVGIFFYTSIIATLSFVSSLVAPQSPTSFIYATPYPFFMGVMASCIFLLGKPVRIINDHFIGFFLIAALVLAFIKVGVIPSDVIAVFSGYAELGPVASEIKHQYFSVYLVCFYMYLNRTGEKPAKWIGTIGVVAIILISTLFYNSDDGILNSILVQLTLSYISLACSAYVFGKYQWKFSVGKVLGRLLAIVGITLLTLISYPIGIYTAVFGSALFVLMLSAEQSNRNGYE